MLLNFFIEILLLIRFEDLWGVVFMWIYRFLNIVIIIVIYILVDLFLGLKWYLYKLFGYLFFLIYVVFVDCLRWKLR